MNKFTILLAVSFITGNTFAQEEPTPIEPQPPVKIRNTVAIEPPVVGVGYEENAIIDFPDVEAEFPGGAASLSMYIQQNVMYPEDARKNGDQGRVYVTFVVERDGSISTVDVMRKGAVAESLEKEAMRLVQSMPKWKPGQVDAEDVRARCRLPITFTLSNQDDEPKK